MHRLTQALRSVEPGRGKAGMAVASKVAGGERLQRVVMGDMGAGFFVGGLLVAAKAPPTITFTNGREVDHIQQLADQYRRRQLGVAARVAADVTQVQAATGRKQGFQQQVAVIQTSRAIATAGFLADQVKARCRGAARQGAIIQPQQADQLKRQAAHRHHGAEGHRAGEKARGGAALLQGGGELLADQRQLNRPLDPRSLALLLERGAGFGQQQQGVTGFTLIKQLIDQPL